LGYIRDASVKIVTRIETFWNGDDGNQALSLHKAHSY